MTDAKISSGMEQMGFEMLDNGVLELPTSTPATYRFVEKATYNPSAFADEIKEYGFGLVGADFEQQDSGEFYYYVDVVTDHYKKVAVKCGKTVRISTRKRNWLIPTN